MAKKRKRKWSSEQLSCMDSEIFGSQISLTLISLAHQSKHVYVRIKNKHSNSNAVQWEIVKCQEVQSRAWMFCPYFIFGKFLNLICSSVYSFVQWGSFTCIKDSCEN